MPREKCQVPKVKWFLDLARLFKKKKDEKEIGATVEIPGQLIFFTLEDWANIAFPAPVIVPEVVAKTELSKTKEPVRDIVIDGLRQELIHLDLMDMTPMQVMDKLYNLKKQMLHCLNQ